MKVRELEPDQNLAYHLAKDLIYMPKSERVWSTKVDFLCERLERMWCAESLNELSSIKLNILFKKVPLWWCRSAFFLENSLRITYSAFTGEKHALDWHWADLNTWIPRWTRMNRAHLWTLTSRHPERALRTVLPRSSQLSVVLTQSTLARDLNCSVLVFR